MTLPTSIWWCEEHGANGDGPLGDGPKPQALHPCCLVAMLAACEDVDLAKPCHMVEVELHPVGSRVAGPDDLVIRREDIDYEAAVAYLEAHLPEDVRPYADRMATETIDAALVGVRSAYAQLQSDCDC